MLIKYYLAISRKHEMISLEMFNKLIRVVAAISLMSFTSTGCSTLGSFTDSFKDGYSKLVSYKGSGSSHTQISRTFPVVYDADTESAAQGTRAFVSNNAFVHLDSVVPREPLPLLPPLSRNVRKEVLTELNKLSHPDKIFGLELTMKRAQSYIYDMEQILSDQGISSDFTIVPFLESNFRTNAVSSQGAVGIWQFTKVTGMDNGLEISFFRDERRDPILSSVAASRLLRNLYENFNDWPLALAAYNAGKPRIELACKHYTHCTFWKLAEDQKIPKQTIRYVPKAIATLVKLEQLDLWPFTTSRSV